MPFYEYQCKKCSTKFEELQKIKDKPLKVCKRCRGKLIKLMSSGGFILKGAGFYKNDYNKGSV